MVTIHRIDLCSTIGFSLELKLANLNITKGDV